MANENKFWNYKNSKAWLLSKLCHLKDDSPNSAITEDCGNHVLATSSIGVVDELPGDSTMVILSAVKNLLPSQKRKDPPSSDDSFE